MTAPSQIGQPPEQPVRIGAVDGIAIVVVLTVEAAGFRAGLLGHLGWPIVLAGHLAISFLIAGAAVARGRAGHEARLLSWLAWLTLTLGPAGPIATALLAMLTALFTRMAKPFDEWYESLFPNDQETRSELLYRRLLTGREEALAEGSVNSLTDVLFTGTTRAKQAVVALLARRFRSDFAPALQMALSDREASIRVQAATAATTIEERYHAQRLELEDAARAAPDDPSAALALGLHLDDYAFAGLLDRDRQREVMLAALAALRAANRGLGAREDVDLSIGRLMLRLGMIEEAEMHLTGLILRYEDPRPLLWHAECLFLLRRFEDLRQVLEDPRLTQLALRDEYSGVNPVINLWQVSTLVGAEALETAR